jgi:hypothetical protein
MKVKAIFASLLFVAMTQTAEAQNLAWAKRIGGAMYDEARSITVDAVGNVYVIGYFAGTVDFDPSAAVVSFSTTGGDDIFIAKFDASGNFLWAKQLGGTGYDYGSGIVTDASGNIHAICDFQGTVDFDPGAGTANLSSSGDHDIAIIKLDANGNFIWVKQLGGAGYDRGYSIALDAVGNVYGAGHFASTCDFDPGTNSYNLTALGNTDAFIVKLDASGNFLWAKHLGGTNTEQVVSIACDTSANIYATGGFKGTVDFDPGSGTYNLTTSGFQDVFAAKFDAAGNFIWAKQFVGTNNNFVESIKTSKNGHVYVAGSFTGIADFDPGIDTNNLTSNGSADIAIVKLDAAGNFIWARHMGGPDYDAAISIACDAYDNVYSVGMFNGTADFDPGAAIFNYTSLGAHDIFISKLDASGNFVWAVQLGGDKNDIGGSITTDNLGNIYTTGYFASTVDFDPQANMLNLTASGFSDIFIHKMSPQDLGMIASASNKAFTVFPNPTKGIFTIRHQFDEDIPFVICDITGKVLTRGLLTSKETSIDLSNLQQGIYLVSIEQQIISITKE